MAHLRCLVPLASCGPYAPSDPTPYTTRLRTASQDQVELVTFPICALDCGDAPLTRTPRCCLRPMLGLLCWRSAVLHDRWKAMKSLEARMLSFADSTRSLMALALFS
jgi:hypothetical protein